MGYKSRFWRAFDRQKLLSGKYVFYNRLLKNGNQLIKKGGEDEKKGKELVAMYENAKKELERLQTNLTEIDYGVSGLLTLADNEYQKERKLLEEIFGVSGLTDQLNLDDVASTQNFMDALNATLQTREVFERNKELLTEGNDIQKLIITYFPTYFGRAFKESWENIIQKRIVESFITGESVENCIEEEIPIILARAVEMMFKEADSELRNGSHKSAYEKFLNQIGTLEDKNSFVRQLYEIYGIKNFAAQIKEKLFSGQEAKKAREAVQARATEIISVNFDQKGGFAYEALSALIGQSLEVSNKGVTISSTRTGQTTAKADVMVTIDVNPEPILEIVEGLSNTSREKNIAAFKQISDHLKKVDGGYVIYQNAKNYLPKTAKGEGFRAGDTLTAEKLIPILRNIDRNANTLVGALLNTAKGAVGADEELKNKISKALMGDIALMLFDDYQTIGDKVRTGARVIHILNLNGIYVPMSLFLKMSARAIENSLENEIVVKTSTKPILFPKQRDQDRWMAKNNASPWQHQKEKALETTTISYRFLRNFQEIISQYLK